MAAQEALTESLQEAVLAVLAFDQKHGSLIAAQVLPEHFDGAYHDVASAVLAYRKRYNKPPGHAHLEDLFSRAKLDSKDRKTHAFRRTLVNLAALAENINAEYVVSRTQDHIRSQKLKTALLQANERYLQGGEDSVQEVEGILQSALRFREATMDAGTFLHQIERSSLFSNKEERLFVPLGIPELDRLGIGPAAKKLLLYIGPKNCLVGETLIDCPRDLEKYPQGIPIKDLVGKQFDTYSWDFEKSRPALSKVLDVWRVGKRRVYRAQLGAGLREAVPNRKGGIKRAEYLPPLELVGTADHPVLLSNGQWKKLGDLKPGDSLMSLYRRASGSPKARYSRINWTNGLPDGIQEHGFICAQKYGPRRGRDAHHKDHRRLNNTPDNVEWLSRSAHASYHLSEANKEGTRGWRVTGKHPKGMKGKRHTAAIKKQISQTSKLSRTPEVIAAFQAAMRAKNDPRLYDREWLLKHNHLTDKGVSKILGCSSEAVRRNKRQLGIARNPALINHTVLTTPQYLGVQDVYDMEVERTENFVANGVFVHNSGKSWACVHVGKQALIHKYKVVHISLEMEEYPELLDRYLQSFFGLATRPEPYIKTTFELDDLGRFVSFKTRKAKPRLDFTDPAVRKWLRNKVGAWGTRFERLVLKEFPSGSLTMSGLRGYLDYLELTQKFIPNVLIVDYPDLMRHDHRDLRLSLSRTFVELRGLAAERNLAIMTPTQSGRNSLGARKVRGRNVTEDVSKLFTADIVLDFSQTEAEEKHGLGRLFVEYARNAPKGMEYLLSQSYATGQYVLQSVLLYGSAYWDQLKTVSGEDAFEGADPWE